MKLVERSMNWNCSMICLTNRYSEGVCCRQAERLFRADQSGTGRSILNGKRDRTDDDHVPYSTWIRISVMDSSPEMF
ncbi:hypothetical protein A6X21_23215 [Planctopirus hydrillae]|uniref:Uncharacterized protein n=1 Tax=Planctopirus hydrillae TaxID=1841610 RepID=A0A1C3ECQ2_9PLAN|nr:hypothetical protein A6X21_23215 [Planctopirus hydrillae]